MRRRRRLALSSMTDCAECSMTTLQRHCSRRPSRGERDSAAAAADGSRDCLATPPRRSLLLLLLLRRRLRADSHGTPCDACARYIAYAAAVRVTDYEWHVAAAPSIALFHTVTRARDADSSRPVNQSISRAFLECGPSNKVTSRSTGDGE